MRVLVADAFPATCRAALTERGQHCSYEPASTPEQLVSTLAEPAGTAPEVLVVRSTRVTEAMLAGATALRLVIRAGSGTDTIDTVAAGRNGVRVCNVPGRNAVAVAELALGLLLAVDRNIPDNVADLRQQRWNKKHYAQARGVAGRRVGIVGLGSIGLAFAERVRACGAEVHAVARPDRSAEARERAEAIGVHFVADVTELARTCDVLSLHVPATDATLRIVDRGLLEHVAPGTIVLNTARAELIDEQALLEAMDAKQVRAGIDVFADEPAEGTGSIDSRLARHPNTYGTHHIGASTEQAQHAIAEEVLRIIDAFEAGSVPPHCVNLAHLPRRDAAPTAAHAHLVSTTSTGGGS